MQRFWFPISTRQTILELELPPQETLDGPLAQPDFAETRVEYVGAIVGGRFAQLAILKLRVRPPAGLLLLGTAYSV